jgi:hypothetical protein
LDGHTRIVKLTGKYILPDLERAIRHITDEARIVYQYRFPWNQWQKCEIFACDRELLEPIFLAVRASETLAEYSVDCVHEALGVPACHFPIMMNLASYKKGDGSVARVI